jgi:hypothetical protein
MRSGCLHLRLVYTSHTPSEYRLFNWDIGILNTDIFLFALWTLVTGQKRSCLQYVANVRDNMAVRHVAEVFIGFFFKTQQYRNLQLR